MTAQDFWNEEPGLLWSYRKVYMDKIKIENELANERAWIQGAYIYDAISKAIYNSFGRKDGDVPEDYMEKPFNFSKQKKTEKEIQEELAIEREFKIKEQFMKGAKLLNKS